MPYDHRAIEAKWQARYEAEQPFKAETGSSKPKFYPLVEFPFPSGAGLHVGHPRSYTALDVVARVRRMQGFNVLYPMGWDAFGLPTENYALKTGIPPAEVTLQNTDIFRRQLKAIGFSFDWSREVNTTDPAYFKWTQWMFLEFFKAGLAYKAKAEINWCPKDKIGLANEEVIGGACERCGTTVEKREKEQWMIAITKYADRLIEDLAHVNYLPKIKKQQEDWIGRSEGAEIDFVIEGREEKITVFTTRPDTIFGVTALVLAPEHPWVNLVMEDRDGVLLNKMELSAYIASVKGRDEDDRSANDLKKTGVEVKGLTSINPVNGENIRIFVADYVLPNIGTGAIMAVPAHDERDREFALFIGDESLFKLVVEIGGQVDLGEFTASQSSDQILQNELQNIIEFGVKHGRGYIVNSGDLNGCPTDESCVRMIEKLESLGVGRKKVTYRLRDWVFSRQRYWGEPIPLVKCQAGCGAEHGGWVPLPVDQLPLTLPAVGKYEPTDTGESPLAAIADWVNTTCPECGGAATRETDTMPNWAGSSWYFLRYVDPHNDQQFASPEALAYWLPVDLYNGGMEHTTLHLLYSRFWYKFLFDRGHIPKSCGNEPYARRHSHGLIMAEDGTKMSKSKGNVVNPDDVVAEYGADVLRTYMLFIGPFEEPVPWQKNGLIGVRRFLEKVERLVERVAEEETVEVKKAVHKAIAKVTKDVEGFHFNTAVSALMTAVNDLGGQAVTKETLLDLLTLLSPMAPHLANELAGSLGEAELLESRQWPTADPQLLVDSEVTIAVQFNGKTRGSVTVPADSQQVEVLQAVGAVPQLARYLSEEPKKVIFIPGKIINIIL
jgi:leucyl-tRNA synthetase